MKKSVVLVLMICVLLLTSCSGASIEKGKKLYKDKKYTEAIEVYDKLIEKDETNYEAWLEKVKTQIKDDEYDEAEETLEDLFKILEDDYGKNDDLDYEKIVDDFQDYAQDIIKEEGSIGDWYTKLQPPTIDIYHMDYMSYEVGSTEKLDVPKGIKVYYNFDGDKVTTKDKEYKDGIKFDEEGAFTLTVAAINKFGIMGQESYAWVTVADLPEVPEPSPASGTYPSPLIVDFPGIDPNTQSLYYTIDGSDPLSYGMYYFPEDGIFMPAGEHTLKAVIYDNNSGLYSKELSIDYVVEAAPAPVPSAQAGTYSGPYTLYFSGFDPMYADVLYTLDGTDPALYGFYYYPDYGIELTPGQYNLRAVIYDYYDYSQEFSGKYTIN